MTDREIKKTQADKLYEWTMLQRATTDKREEIIKNQIAQTKASMTIEEISHVMEMLREAGYESK